MFDIVKKVNATSLVTGAKSIAYRTGFQIRKHSPEICMIVGGVAFFGALFNAGRASMKLPDVLQEHKETIEIIKKTANDPEKAEVYSEEDAARDTRIVRVRTAGKIVKLYSSTAILAALSLGSMFESNHILRERSAAIAVTYAALNQKFKDYRGRVIEKYGEEIDKNLLYGVQEKMIRAEKIDENNPNNTFTEEKKVAAVNTNALSDYSVIFDELNSPKFWQNNPDYNMTFLLARQHEANMMLKLHGHLFLNEVYDLLGIARTKAGQVVGWVYDPNDPRGDNRVDFGIFPVDILEETPRGERAREFINHNEANIILDFNVDGDILSVPEGFYKHNKT